MRKLSLLACGVVVALTASGCFGAPPPTDPHRDVVVFGDSNADGIGCLLGDPSSYGPAATRYRSQLQATINLFRSRGAKVLVLNSPYYAPAEPQVPGVPVWYERYPNDGGSGTAGLEDWVAPNANLTYRPSKV